MEDNQLIIERKNKRTKIMELGLPSYARGFERNIVTTEAKKQSTQDIENITAKPKNEFRLCGRLMTFREHGKICFGQLQDISGRIQLCFMRDFTEITGLEESEEMSHEKFYKKMIDLGDFLGVVGDLFITKHGEVTVLVKELHFLAKALRPLPEKWHGITDQETRYRERYLDLLTNNETAERFRIRSEVVREIRRFLEQKDFMEIETRILQPQAGGALAKVFSTHHNALDHEFVLRIALEIDLKMAMAGGVERVFEIGKCFRNEGMDPSHLQEFTMLEWYAAYATMEDNMDWTEEMIKEVLAKVIGTTTVEILDKNEEPLMIDFGKPWKRARFPELVKEYADLDMFTADMEEIQNKAKEYGMSDKELKKTSKGNLWDFIYKKSARPHLLEPTFVLDYPSELKPLARPKEDGTAECYQLLVGGWEVVNSYGELVDPVVQRKLLEEQSAAKAAGDEEAMEVDEDFLKAMEHGMPPMTGFGMGIDRFVSLITEQLNLRDVVLFPLMKPSSLSQEGDFNVKEEIIAKKDSTSVVEKKTNQEILKDDENAKKLVAVLNKKIPSGKIMNALMHMSLGLSKKSGVKMNFLQYEDADQGVHENISHYNAIVLRADTSNKIRNLRNAAQEMNIDFTDFTSTMSEGGSTQQIKNTANTKEEDLEYWGICLFGDSEKIEILTKKFSLWQ